MGNMGPTPETDKRWNGLGQISFNSLPIVRKENSILVLLPKQLWREAGKCTCPYCKGRMGYWDTVVIPVKPDRERDWTYTVHYPELHNRRPQEPNEMFHAYIGEMRGGQVKITTDRDCLSPDLIRFDERVFATEKDMLDCAMSYRNRGYKVCVDTGSIFQDYR